MKNLVSILALSASLMVGCQSSKPKIVNKIYPSVNYSSEIVEEIKYKQEIKSNERLKISNLNNGFYFEDIPKLEKREDNLLDIRFEEKKYSCFESESKLCLFLKLNKDDKYRLFLKGICQNNNGNDFGDDKNYHVSFGIERKF